MSRASLATELFGKRVRGDITITDHSAKRRWSRQGSSNNAIDVAILDKDLAGRGQRRRAIRRGAKPAHAAHFFVLPPRLKHLARRGIEQTMKHGLVILSLAGALIMLSCAREGRSSERKAAGGRSRTVVLELFTSQGCSSCPPADALLSRLRREDFGGSTVIPLAYHVDYWNHLGWSDPFSSPRWSQRQNLYARTLKKSQVYTPQIIINGSVQLVGSADGPIRAEIERQLDGADRGAVFIDRVALAGNEITVDLRARLDGRASGRRANLVVVLFENGVTTAVASGENARRSLTNDAIVRWQDGEVVLSANGVESKTSVIIPLSSGWRPDRLGIAAFIQDSVSLAIHASAVRGVVEK